MISPTHTLPLYSSSLTRHNILFLSCFASFIFCLPQTRGRETESVAMNEISSLLANWLIQSCCFVCETLASCTLRWCDDNGGRRQHQQHQGQCHHRICDREVDKSQSDAATKWYRRNSCCCCCWILLCQLYSWGLGGITVKSTPDYWGNYSAS